MYISGEGVQIIVLIAYFQYIKYAYVGGRGSKNCPYCLISVQKICLHRGEGVKKSPKLCLRNI